MIAAIEKIIVIVDLLILYMHIYICNRENNMPYQLSRKWLCSNSCTLEHDVRLHIAGTNEPKSAQQAKQGA